MAKLFTDQMNRLVSVEFPPKRIISLVPSQTELLYHLGLRDEVVGQTLFCIHPAEMHASKPRVGGTKKLKMEAIHALKPDLIIGNKEENEQIQIEELMQQYPVWMSDITDIAGALDMIRKIGELVNRKSEGDELAGNIKKGLSDFSTNKKGSAAYFIWREPYMAAGGNTFINDMLKKLGYTNVFEAMDSRYPAITEAELKQHNPDYILLSSEPYPFKQKHIDELKRICPDAIIQLVDGEKFSWYGSRLQWIIYDKNYVLS